MKFDGLNSLAKAYVEIEGKQSRSVEIPGEGATVEEAARYNSLLRGGIDSPDKYDLSGVKMPSEDKLTPEGMEAVQQMAFDTGMTQEQVVKAVEWDAERTHQAVADVRRAVQANRRDSELSLRKEWGGEFEPNLDRARVAVQKYGSEEALGVLKNTGLGSHPAIVRMFADIGKATAEAVAPRGVNPGDMQNVPFPKAAAAQEARQQRRSGGA